MSVHRFSFPTSIHFGDGARKLLKAHLAERGLKRPLVVTDRGLAGLPVFQEILGMLSDGGLLQPGSFSGIWGNPVKSQVQEGVRAFKAHQADSIVGVGGGAALDVAKAIALWVNHPGDLFDYEDEKPGALPIDREIPYWVAVPTTSGTGSEVGRSAVVADDQSHVKKILFSPRLLAQAVFADPELTLALPAPVTAATGMDALTHCVESYLAKGYHPICDGIALEGLRLAAAGLVRSVKNPTDREARGQMMMSSMMGAIAFQKGLGVTHSCAHALSTVADFHHGFANGVMIDHALKFNLEAVPERFEILAVTIGLGGGSRGAGGSEFLRWLKDLKAEIGIPAGLTAAGAKREDLDRLVEIAVADICHLNNPRACKREDFVHLFSEAFS